MFGLLDELKEFMLTSNILCASLKEKVKEKNRETKQDKDDMNRRDDNNRRHDIKKRPDNNKTDGKDKEKELVENLRHQGNKVFVPKEKDTLFWCFYIMKFGETEYEKIKVQYPNTFIIEKQLKFGYIDRIRKEKELVKSTKLITLSEIENQLANEPKINISTFFTLCAIEKINVFYVGNNKTYFEYPDLNGVMNYPSMHVIKRLDAHNKNKYKGADKESSSGKSDMKRKHDSAFYGYEGVRDDTSVYRNQLLKIDRFDKPIKPISAYKLNELIEISNKLGIQPTSVSNQTKKELYDLIIDFL